MNKDEQVVYLANIYHVLLADGAAERIEERVFEGIARDIGAGFFERKGGMESAQSEQYQIELVGRWSDRIRNLEDMLFAAFCNGVLEPAEKEPIKDYAGKLGINQQQFDIIKQETKRRYAEHKAKAR